VETVVAAAMIGVRLRVIQVSKKKKKAMRSYWVHEEGVVTQNGDVEFFFSIIPLKL
jgi:hypothetical protein